jgi:hypothetical protein
MQIGKTPFEESHNDPQYQRLVSRLDVAIMSQHTTDETALSIKQLNPDILLGVYTNIIEVGKTWCCDHERWRNKIEQEVGPNPDRHPDWWVRTADTGEKIEVWPGTWRVNITDFVRPDSEGRNWIDYRVEYDNQRWFSNDVWDIWYSDVVHYEPRYRSGPRGTFSGGRATAAEENAAYRRAHRRHWDGIYAARPGTIVGVNFNWYVYQHEQGKWDLEVYDQVVQNGFFENALVARREHGHPWHVIHQWQLWAESYLKKPAILIFHVVGPRDDYQFARYGLTTALMGNGFFKFSPDDGYLYGTVEWFDEFDLAGTADTSWLGLAVTPPPSAPWQQGVYRRDFQNGIALVNPKRNGPQTVTIEEGFRRFLGTQDPVVNNGQPAREITLEAGDGIVLVRESGSVRPPALPQAPQLRIGS